MTWSTREAVSCLPFTYKGITLLAFMAITLHLDNGNSSKTSSNIGLKYIHRSRDNVLRIFTFGVYWNWSACTTGFVLFSSLCAPENLLALRLA
ncbi:hypothetical protein BCR44DRAFT_1423809 [Catenaria anguillulae PL171]|uniref:Uncharacterized protein n=1 Tax=Catenaria anguillulae PL171 TaxID=765915 RepID=A0A1Y2I1P9_9FUNG|nr:hypothetical protein BCR44DRAFT_1423809 [Catenaria anguillulae PL171]